MNCWKCGRSIPLLVGGKVSARDSCPQCDSDLRVCHNCRHFDPSAHHECREPIADWVRYKDRATYCDYFSANTAVTAPGPGANGPRPGDARRKFDDLFKK